MARPGRGGRRLLRGRILLNSLLSEAGRSTGVYRLHGPREVATVFEQLAPTIRSEMLSMLPESPDAAAAMRSSRDEDSRLLRQGVVGRLVYEPAWAEDAEVADEVRLRLRAGAEARVVDRVPHRLTIFDRHTAILPLDPAAPQSGTLVVRDRDVVSDLRALFVAIWRGATDFEDLRPEKRVACTPRDMRVIQLLSRGATDETGAREMNVSVRTYRRYVADIMSALGAQSRFQAGVLAVERGWL